MKNIKLGIFILLAGLSLIQSTPFSQSSMIDIPTGYILPHSRLDGSFNLHVHYPYGWSEEPIFYFGILSRGEVGVSVPLIQWEGEGSGDVRGQTARFYLHGKYQIFKESRIFPAMAVGLTNIGSDGKMVETGIDVPDGAGFIKDYQSNSLYFVLSKQMLIRPIYDRLIYCDFHWGMGIRRYVGDTPVTKTFHGLFTGLDVYVSDKLNIMLEEDGNDFNLGFQYMVTDQLAVRFAWVKLEELMQETDPFPNLGLGVRYTFGPFWGKKSKVTKLYNIEDRRAFLMKGAVDIHEDTLKLIIQMNKLKKQREMLEGKLKGLKNAVDELKKERKSQ